MQDDGEVMGLFRTSHITLKDGESATEAFTLPRHNILVWGHCITDSTEMCASWEAANSATTHELSSIFVTVFTRAIHRSLYWARSIQSMRSHLMSLRSILISTHPRLRLPSALFPYGFHINNIRILLHPDSCYMLCSSHSPWLDHSNYTWLRVQIM
jgi:hypothetical protein